MPEKKSLKTLKMQVFKFKVIKAEYLHNPVATVSDPTYTTVVFTGFGEKLYYYS